MRHCVANSTATTVVAASPMTLVLRNGRWWDFVYVVGRTSTFAPTLAGWLKNNYARLDLSLQYALIATGLVIGVKSLMKLTNLMPQAHYPKPCHLELKWSRDSKRLKGNSHCSTLDSRTISPEVGQSDDGGCQQTSCLCLKRVWFFKKPWATYPLLEPNLNVHKWISMNFRNLTYESWK